VPTGRSQVPLPQPTSSCSTPTGSPTVPPSPTPGSSRSGCARSWLGPVELFGDMHRVACLGVCQPCRHRAMCCLRLRDAHGAHLSSAVALPSAYTISLAPVSGSMRRKGTGCRHTPCSLATCSIRCVAIGIRARAARELSGVVAGSVDAVVGDDIRTGVARDSDDPSDDYKAKPGSFRLGMSGTVRHRS
jgi:hypothetical protein